MASSVEWSGKDGPSRLTVTTGKPAAPFAARRRTMPGGPGRPLSLQARALLAATVALCALLALTGFALDQAFYESSLKELSYRLRSHVYGYLKDTDVSVSGRLIPPEFPPDSRFDRPQSGLYASMVGIGTTSKVRWESPSALSQKLAVPDDVKPGEERFVGPVETPLGKLYVYSMGVLLPWSEKGEPREMRVVIQVAEHESGLTAQLEVFRRTLWTWLGALGIVVLLVELLLLRWSLTPLRQVSSDLARVERAEQERLSEDYPAELMGLTRSLNDFIESEREQRQRYRNTLSDLAHSLKTPLAVVRGELEDKRPVDELRGVVDEQVRRMDEIVQYQLSRAATAGHKTFAVAISLDRLSEEVVRSLEKVHAQKGVLCEFEIDPEARFYGEQGDLMELLGNLLENAFKWADRRVLLTVRRIGPVAARRRGLEIIVEDDGPGIPENQVQRLLQRGERGDERVQGHGIGLAIVRDIVRAYRGTLVVDRSANLGGASFTLQFGPLT